MIIEYTPEGGQTETYDASRLRASEIQIIERTADMRWEAVKEGLLDGDVTARRTVAWALKKRAQADLRLAAFDPFEDEIVVKLDARETAHYAAKIVTELADKPESLAAAFEELRGAAADAEACELAIKEAQAPKAPAPAPVQAPVPETVSDSPTGS